MGRLGSVVQLTASFHIVAATGRRRGASAPPGRLPSTDQNVKYKVKPSCHVGPQGDADLPFTSPQPDTSLHCETTDTGLMNRAACLFTPQLSLVLVRLPTDGWPG